MTAALRQIRRDRFTSAINVFSLATGLCAVLLTMIYVEHETRYDRWIPNAPNIHRLETEHLMAQGESAFHPYSPTAALQVLMDRYPEIENGTRFRVNLHSIHLRDRVVYEWVTFADSNLLDVLQLPLAQGYAAGALSDPRALMVSESMALKYFGEGPAIGKTLSIESDGGGETRDYTVTAVFRNLPETSHVHFDFIAANSPNDDQFGFGTNDPWERLGAYTYLQFQAGSNPEKLEAEFPGLMDEFLAPPEWTMVEKGSELYRLHLTPLTAIHMNSRNSDPLRPLGDWQLVIALSAIAVLIAILACINFTNLALARSLTRAREVSLRKIHGAGRLSLVAQYLLETLLLTLAALGIALLLASFFLPHLNALIDKPLELGALLQSRLLIPVALLIVCVTLLAGLYPALVLSAYRPVTLFRAFGVRGSTSHRLRYALLVFQFAASITLAIGASVIHLQRNYTAGHDLGFSMENKLVIRWMNWGHFADHAEVIQQRISTLPSVQGTTFSNMVPGDPVQSVVPATVDGTGSHDIINLRAINVNENFFDLYDVELIAGRTLSWQYGLDDSEDAQTNEQGQKEFSSLINERAVKALGFKSPQDAIGKVLSVSDSVLLPRIVGVVSDFHFRSLRESILPATFYMDRSGFSNLTVELKPGADVQQAVAAIETIWRDLIPRDPITLEFLDQNLEKYYESDRRQGIMLTALAVLALIVACVGQYALASTTAAEKAREVSIRKVHGASGLQILSLLGWHLTQPVILAVLLAWPLAWLGARHYLDQFSYRIEPGFGLFLGVAVAALGIAALTVSGHAARAALTKPAHALRERG